MVSKEEFREFCKSLIPKEELDEIEKYNQKRAKIIKKTLTFGIIGFVALFLITIIITRSIMSTFVVMGSVFAPSAIILLIVFVLTQSSSKHKVAKDKYTGEILKFLLKDYKYTYNPEGAISDFVFINSRFGNYSELPFDNPFDDLSINLNIGGINLGNFEKKTKPFDSYVGEDLLKIDIPKDDGSPSGVELQVCDLNVTREERVMVDGEWKDRTVTVFDGVFGYIHFPFKFKCRLGININLFDMQKITLEDIKFNKKFAIYTDNPIEALVIVTPTLMVKLMEFAKKIYGFKLYLSPDGDVYFKMDRNLFSLKVANNGSPVEIFDRFYDDICAILGMVNEFKDNNRVFKM